MLSCSTSLADGSPTQVQAVTEQPLPAGTGPELQWLHKQLGYSPFSEVSYHLARQGWVSLYKAFACHCQLRDDSSLRVRFAVTAGWNLTKPTDAATPLGGSPRKRQAPTPWRSFSGSHWGAPQPSRYLDSLAECQSCRHQHAVVSARRPWRQSGHCRAPVCSHKRYLTHRAQQQIACSSMPAAGLQRYRQPLCVQQHSVTLHLWGRRCAGKAACS